MHLVRKRQQIYITYKTERGNESSNLAVDVAEVKEEAVKVSLLDPAYDSDYMSDETELGRLNEHCANNYVIYDGTWHVLAHRISKYLRLLKERNIHLCDVVYISKRDKYESLWEFTRQPSAAP